MPRSSSRLGRQTNSRKFQARLPQSHQTHRQAIRIPQSSRLECLNRTSRTGRPHEYLKAARSFASTGQVAPAGQTNTSKLPAHLPQPDKSHRQAIRIPQSSCLKCLQPTSRTGGPFEYLKVPDLNAYNRTSRTGRPYEYLKAARSIASIGQVNLAGHTNTTKLPAHLPTTDKSHRQAIRIPQSCPLICLNRTSRTGGPHEYLKAAGSFAYNRQVEPAGHTNTLKPPVQLPQPDKSIWQAIRILQNRPLICLNRTSRTGRPYEYLKAARSIAHNRQVASAGHTNTSKPPAHLPQPDKSNRRAIRILQSRPLNCLNRTSRTGRPCEYLKVPDLNASTGQVEPAGHTNTSKLLPQMPPTDKSNRRAIRIPQSSRLECLNRTSRTGGPYEYLKVPDLNASTGQVVPAGHSNTSKLPAHLPTTDKSNRRATRIPQSSCLNCFQPTSREGRPI